MPVKMIKSYGIRISFKGIKLLPNLYLMITITSHIRKLLMSTHKIFNREQKMKNKKNKVIHVAHVIKFLKHSKKYTHTEKFNMQIYMHKVNSHMVFNKVTLRRFFQKN